MKIDLVITGGNQDSSRPVALTRALVATVAMSAGFLTVFGVFGLLISPLIASAQKFLPFATVVIGVLLIALAGWLFFRSGPSQKAWARPFRSFTICRRSAAWTT